MKSIDYIRRTLPHGLNLNILTQLFAEDGIEVTDEIRTYLNTTPWNTNIKVLESLTGNDSSAQAVVGDDIVLLDGTYEFKKHSINDYALYSMNLDKSYSPESVIVTIDGKTVILPKAISQSGNIGYGEYDAESLPLFVTYPVDVLISSSKLKLVVMVPTAGEHTVKVTVPNEEESAEVLFESELKFTLNPAGAYAHLGSSDIKNNIFDKLSDNDNIRIIINNHSITGTVLSKESSDGYETIKYLNLTDTSYCDKVEVTWDHYGQDTSARLGINIKDAAGTYNVKIEKL